MNGAVLHFSIIVDMMKCEYVLTGFDPFQTAGNKMQNRRSIPLGTAIVALLSSCMTPVSEGSVSDEARFIQAMTKAGCYHGPEIASAAGLTPAQEKAMITRLVASGKLEVLIPGYRLKDCP